MGSLSEGLKGDPTYIIVKEDGKSVENFGVNSVCTHLGCVVPWNAAENKFKGHCHGSQYNFQGKVVRGPAPCLWPSPTSSWTRRTTSCTRPGRRRTSGPAWSPGGSRGGRGGREVEERRLRLRRGSGDRCDLSSSVPPLP